MASFRENGLTNVGQLMLADIQLGGEFDPTRIVLGSGMMPSNKTVEDMTDVVTPEVSLAINKKEKTSNGLVVLGAYFSNKEIGQPFYWRELAIYARHRTLNSDGSYTYSDEVLYSYGNAGEQADYIPVYGSNDAVERQIDLVTWIGNRTQINLSIEGGVFVTHLEMAKAIGESEGRMSALIYDLEYRTNRDLIALGYRVDAVEDRLQVHDDEIVALKSNDVDIHSRINEVAAQASAVWDALFNDITENPAIVDFDTLDGFTLTGGVWNSPLRRLEV